MEDFNRYLEEQFDVLISNIKKYNPHTDVDLIKQAYIYATEAHKGQFRKSGEPYIIHPIGVAQILSTLNVDDSTIIAGLFHDVIEDTGVSYEDIEFLFNDEIAYLVEGVTKLKSIKFETKKDNQAENLRKMVLAMAKDIRVIIIKLADRLHNMRTLEYMTREKQIEKSTETIEIYAPLAHRLGISKIKSELEDLSLKYLEPEMYFYINNKINESKEERESHIQQMIDELSKKIDEAGIKYEISGRAKSIYSIYKKMYRKHLSFEEIKDLSAIRVIVDKESECYDVLGIVHRYFRPITGTFKDYIASPKPNKYQSLHTTVLANDGKTYEIQIRTWEMHRTSEYGIAAHWKYKENSTKSSAFDVKLSWLREIMDWQKDYTDSKEFMDLFTQEFSNDEVFVYSPKGDVIDLPMGSTPIDFAYRVHSAVGNKCVGAKVNNKIVPLAYQLKTGDIVEILTNPNSGPSADWLSIVKSSQAKTKIKQWFKKEKRSENIVSGRDMLEKSVAKLGYSFNEILKVEWIEEIAERLSFNSVDDMYASLGYGSTKVTQIIPKLIEYHKEYYETEKAVNTPKHVDIVNPSKTSESRVVIDGMDDLDIKLAKCCNPVPGDQIVGYITKGRGISVHRRSCPNLKNVDDKERFIPVSWNDKIAPDGYLVELEILAFDRVGFLAEVTKRISENKINVKSMNSRISKDGSFIINVVLMINNSKEINDIILKLKGVEGTIDVYRV